MMEVCRERVERVSRVKHRAPHKREEAGSHAPEVSGEQQWQM